MIKMKNIIKKYGSKTVLNNFNLQIHSGELVSIIGPSGAGKSTILNIIGLIEDFDGGTYELMGHVNVKPNSRESQKIIREKISYLFQNYALIEDQTVYQNLLLALKYIKKNKEEKSEIIQDSLNKVGLADYAQNYVYELSGGQQQRVAVARAIIKPSELILADEPTGSLDPKNRDEIFNLLVNINKQESKTIVIVTHDTELAHKCNRCIELH